jgi:hypothetical protein
MQIIGNTLKLFLKISPTSMLNSITPIGVIYAYKRNFFFILELLKNQATNELVSKGIDATLQDTVKSLGITKEDEKLGPNHTIVSH